KLLFRPHDAGPWAHARVAQHGVIAALGLERDLVPEHSCELVRPGAGSDDDRIHLMAARRRNERPRAIGIHFDIEHLLAEDGPALAPHAVGQRLDQPERIEAIAVLGKEDAFRKKWRQCRLVLPELFSREHLDAGAMTPAQLPT